MYAYSNKRFLLKINDLILLCRIAVSSVHIDSMLYSLAILRDTRVLLLYSSFYVWWILDRTWDTQSGFYKYIPDLWTFIYCNGVFWIFKLPVCVGEDIKFTIALKYRISGSKVDVHITTKTNTKLIRKHIITGISFAKVSRTIVSCLWNTTPTTTTTSPYLWQNQKLYTSDADYFVLPRMRFQCEGTSSIDK